MTTTELKQRIAEAIKPFWGNYIIGRDVCQLLQDCLTHIEEMEKRIKNVVDERNEAVSNVVAERDLLQSQLREREAEIARLQSELYEAHERISKADRFAEQLGYRHCTSPACNCNGYHLQRSEPEV